MAWPRWPQGMVPRECPVYVTNERQIDAPPEAVWHWLTRADLWPTWFRRASRVRFPAGGGPTLELGTQVQWRMLGASINVTVRVCEPPYALDWEGGAAGVHAYHAWLLEPRDGGTRVRTEETERGPLPWIARWFLGGVLHRAHEDWLESLERVVARDQRTLDAAARPEAETRS